MSVRFLEDLNVDGEVVSENLLVSSSQGNSSSYNWLVFNNEASGYGDWNFYKLSSNNLGLGYGVTGGSSYSNAITFKYGGNIGIGTTNPAYKLDVNGSLSSGQLYVNQNAAALNMVGTDHTYMQWFPAGLSGGRHAYTGFAGGGTNHFTIANETSGANIDLTTNSGTVNVTGNLSVSGTIDGVDIGANYANWNTAYGWGDHSSAGYLTSSSTQSKYLRSDANDSWTGKLTWAGSDYADGIDMSLGNINDAHYVDANEYRQRASGRPRNNLGDPTVTEMALFEEQFGPKTTLANDYDDLSDLTFWGQETSSSSWVEITSYSDDQKRKFLRTNNSGVIIPNTYYKFRVEFTAKSYTFANAMYMYWSSNSHNTQVHIWKKRCSDGTWLQHTSATNTISSWPGHGWLPFSNIPWHETNTTSTGHFTDIRVEFTPNWSTGSSSSNNINIYGMQIWGGYPKGRRTPHYYDQNGEFNFLKDAHLQDGKFLKLGTGNDLKLYHDGSNSYIDESGTGSLIIKASNNLAIRSATDENYIYCTSNGNVRLYYDNAQKLETTSSGVKITGTIGNLDSGIGQQLEYGSTAVTTLRFDSDRWRLYAGGTGSEVATITEGGNFGVGTTSPAYKLDVAGDGIRATRSTAGWAGWFENTGDSSGVVVTAGVDSGDAPLLIRKQDGTELFSVRGDGTSWFKNGNVGVGTSTPNKNFTVEWEDNNASVDTGEGLGGGTAGSGVLLENTSTTANSYANLDFRSNNADGRIAYKYNSINDGDFHFITDNGNSPETKLFIKSSGNVGIGTTSPDSLLEISSSSATDFLKLTSGGGSATPVKLIFEKSGSEQGIIEYNRNGDLEIYNTDGDGGVMIDGSASAGGDLYVNNAGNVGIGTTSPGEKLEVDGNIAVSGTVDGRDIATDGTKLDTVDTNADVTPSWVPSSDPSYLTAHPNISAASSVNNSGKTHIQDITVDSNGHVTGIVSHALTSSDFLEPNSNATLNSLSCGTFTHPTDISFVLDNDNNETASFTIKDGVGNSPFTLTEAGDLTITGKFVSTYAAKASSGDILVEDSGEIKKRTPTELKTDLSLNNVPNTDATNANNLASGTVPTARLATTAIAKGGTGATSASGARAALGAAASSHTHAASDITSGTFDSNRVKQICTTHHNFFMNSSSTTTDFFIPYNNLNESSNPTNSIYYGRMVAPYDGRIVKVVLHTTAAIGTACQVLFWVATSSGTFAPSAAETVTGVNLNTANTSATATFSTTSTAEFDEGDVLGVSIIKSSSATANMQVTVVWEYTV